jgi:hypothetical protein
MIRVRPPAVFLRVLTLAALVLAVAPAGAQAFSKAIWGPVTRNGKSEFPLYRKLGVKVFEIDLNWRNVATSRPAQATNPADPAYSWPSDVQQAVTQASRYHMQVLLQIIGAPSWSNGGKAFNYPPSNLNDYANFATAAARKYPNVHLWMIWGEPSRHANWAPDKNVSYKTKHLSKAQQVGPHTYARMLNDAYGALKKVSKRNLVIGGNTFSGVNIDTQQWIENLKLPNGKPPRMDMYGHNPFSYTPPKFTAKASPDGEVQFKDLKRLAGWIDRYLHKGMPIFLSEWTIPSAPDSEFGFWVNKPVAARWVTQAFKEARKWKRIYGLGWIHLYDDPTIAPDGKATSYGGLMSNTGKPKPVFYAFQHG